MSDHDENVDVDALIQRARDGDEAARSELLDKYRSYLVLIARRAVGAKLQRRVDASDIVQQTCTEAWRDLDKFRGSEEPEFSAWICQILRRNVANVVRDQRAAKRDMGREVEPANDGTASVVWIDPPGKEATASQQIIQGEKALLLATVLDGLPDGQREAVRMRHLEGLPLAEIAQRLEKTTVAAAGLIKRGLQALRQGMAESDWR